jgi:hypothetical protein
MISIGFIDDREDSRQALSRTIKRIGQQSNIKPRFFSSPPFERKEDCINWIQENEISVLLLDQKLREENTKIEYDGHELGKFLQKHFKDLPIYIFTNYPKTQVLEEVKYDFYKIISKTQFGSNLDYGKEIFNLFIKTGRNFHNNYHKRLERLSELSRKIALGEAIQEEITEAKGIQQYLEIPMTADLFNDRAIWLNEFSEKLNTFEKTTNEIDEFLKKYNNDELDIN